MTFVTLCRKVPASVQNGSIQKTREWRAQADKGLALAGNSRASIPQLTAHIATMRLFG